MWSNSATKSSVEVKGGLKCNILDKEYWKALTIITKSE
jgi:hypothetical protein